MFRIAAVVSLVLLATTAAGAENLIPNGGFDEGMAGWHSRHQTDCVSGGWDSGVAWIQLQCTTVADASWLQSIPISGGRAYRIRYRARSLDLAGKADLNLSFTDTNGDVVWGVPVHSFTDSTEWTEFSWAFHAPEDAVRLEITLGVEHCFSGRVEFDEVVLEEAADNGPRILRVDCSSTEGNIRDLQQTNRGTLLLGHDYSAQFGETGTRLVRTHDYNGPFDMSEIFPDPEADADDPASYDFAATDALMLEIYSHGVEVFFRLGESWHGPPSSRMSPQKWSRVALNVVRHFNDGWAEGYELRIHYWEIWNEPNSGHFWTDSEEAYADLYAAAAIAIKNFDSSLMVGGPGLAGYTSPEWTRDFLAMLVERGAPLDFFSWHLYHMGNPHTAASAQRTIRRLVDEAGFPDAEIINTEWNLNPGSSCPDVNCGSSVLSAYSAAHLVSAITYWQDTDIVLAFRYRTDAYPIFGLFGDGEEYPRYSPSGWAYLFLDAFRDHAVRLHTEGGDDAGYTIMAGRKDVGKGPISIIISDPGSADTAYELWLDNAPENFRWRIEEISDEQLCDLGSCEIPIIASGENRDLDGAVLRVAIHPPAVHRITITPLGSGRELLQRTPPLPD